MKCPNCNVNLLITERQGIEIDYCPECRGVWLDRGELDKFIDKSNNFIPTSHNQQHSSQNYNHNQSNQSHSHSYDPSHHQHHKKKESWISDIFDF